MKKTTEYINKHRVTTGIMKSDDSYGNNGAFIFPYGKYIKLVVVSAIGLGWEHVSVHAEDKGNTRTPNWDEMNHIKDLFWCNEETVVQFHPRKTQYVNIHPDTLHLWKQIDKEYDLPIKLMI